MAKKVIMFTADLSHINEMDAVARAHLTFINHIISIAFEKNTTQEERRINSEFVRRSGLISLLSDIYGVDEETFRRRLRYKNHLP